MNAVSCEHMSRINNESKVNKDWLTKGTKQKKLIKSLTSFLYFSAFIDQGKKGQKAEHRAED